MHKLIHKRDKDLGTSSISWIPFQKIHNRTFILFTIIFLSILASYSGHAQTQDSTKNLEDITINAFSHGRPLLDIPAAIAKISTADLDRFGNTNILPALNAQPGIRMEERSPGSYRISIRGSTIRSPFGVRNVKVYWNGLPLTDHGGNTYLNLLDFGSIDNLEIIKGPGSSLYGAGTGGVMLLGKNPINENKISADLIGGGFGLLRYRVGVDKSFSKFNIGADYAHQQSDGYREQSAMKRDMIALRSNVLVGKKSSLLLNFFHSDLSYQTPGGLTKLQYDTMPSMARPGAVARKAAIYNKTFFGGITLESEWGTKWTSTISAFGSVTAFENPTTRNPPRNYEKRKERMGGLRIETQYKMEKGKLVFGGEYQPGYSFISEGTNNGGVFSNATSNLRFPSSMGFLFMQYDRELPRQFFLTAGLSVNKLIMKVDDFTGAETRSFDPILSPRLALLKKFGNQWSVYTSYSRGYSPPTTGELYPSSGVYNSTLAPELGNNYEVGFKGSFGFFQPSVTVYSFHLDQTIVLRRDANEADFFVNAGKTSQNGVEVFLKFVPPMKMKTQKISGWISYSYNDYQFKDYIRNTNDFSGNNLTGTPPHVASAGLDYLWKGLYLNATANYVDRIPLNDANTDFASEYFLVGLRMGYRFGKNEKPFECFAGADNLLDQKYSLGNDLNAPAPAFRYYNAAPGRNYFVGLKVRLGFK